MSASLRWFLCVSSSAVTVEMSSIITLRFPYPRHSTEGAGAAYVEAKRSVPLRNTRTSIDPDALTLIVRWLILSHGISAKSLLPKIWEMNRKNENYRHPGTGFQHVSG